MLIMHLYLQWNLILFLIFHFSVEISLAHMANHANNEIVVFDIKPYLFMELILKEKDFRASLASIDWTQFENKIVGIFCSTDAIIPMWANMLIVANLSPFAKSVYFGDENKTRELVLLEAIQNICLKLLQLQISRRLQ